MVKKELVDFVSEFYENGKNLVSRKNSDYSVNNDAFSNFRYAEMVKVDFRRAILVRICDKIARISNLLDKDPIVYTESITDSILDAANYLAILAAALKDEKDKKELI